MKSKCFPALNRVSKIYDDWVSDEHDPRAGAHPQQVPTRGQGSTQACGLVDPSFCKDAGAVGWIYVILGKHGVKAVYVGFTHAEGGLLAQFYAHFSEKKAHDAESKQLQRDMHSYGIKNFIILGLEKVTFTETNDVAPGEHAIHRHREQFWITRLDSFHNGYNRRREIAQHAHAARAPTPEPRRAALYQQREYPLKALHLLNHWIAAEGRLDEDYFQNFKSSKLRVYVSLWSLEPADSPQLKLSQLLAAVLHSRHNESLLLQGAPGRRSSR